MKTSIFHYKEVRELGVLSMLIQNRLQIGNIIAEYELQQRSLLWKIQNAIKNNVYQFHFINIQFSIEDLEVISYLLSDILNGYHWASVGCVAEQDTCEKLFTKSYPVEVS